MSMLPVYLHILLVNCVFHTGLIGDDELFLAGLGFGTGVLPKNLEHKLIINMTKKSPNSASVNILAPRVSPNCPPRSAEGQ